MQDFSPHPTTLVALDGVSETHHAPHTPRARPALKHAVTDMVFANTCRRRYIPSSQTQSPPGPNQATEYRLLLYRTPKYGDDREDRLVLPSLHHAAVTGGFPASCRTGVNSSSHLLRQYARHFHSLVIQRAYREGGGKGGYSRGDETREGSVLPTDKIRRSV